MPSQENGFGGEPPAEVTAPGIDVTALNRAVDDGSLWIDGLLVADGAHERCARQYEQLADQVEAQIRILSAATSLPGFGGFASGDALRDGFERKADGAIARLSEYATAARELAQTFRAAAAAYQQADQAQAMAVERIDVTGAAHA
ncbi:hypothetical protein OHA40_21870 [Nocardia sp. NBC_00508]|uniref:hypothetical protein n=1 Tax=Nocardia sp. NBC_00508 TaxID=2975992 RepID=UPI002E804C23|nr:hypothetical protein [Nocardia sp. NBC_00508]WUD64340.1 hypothetical protein OHA40_21870 [Nocardia sp. NBC_00508]